MKPTRRSTLFAITAIMAIMLIAGPASAARNTMSVSVADTDFGSATMAYVGDTSAKATNLKSTSDASYWVRAACVQDGVTVYEQSVKVAGGTAELTPGTTTLWQGGDADCTAELSEWTGRRFRVKATDTFHVSG